MASSPRRRWTIRTLVAVLATVVLLFPLPVRDRDRERAITRSAQALLTQRRVMLDGKYIPFHDVSLIAKRKPQWHFLNDTDLDLDSLEDSAFRPMSRSEIENVNVFDWYERNAWIEITTRDSMEDGGPPFLRFNVYHGALGAQGYRVRIHRCILGLFTHYHCEWVS
ncbi:MAG: hypothetical protein CMJ48_05915 [Planctomycetaceae bacterium]|nr:hypothetical protein [Planctomycetaceae bacterium]